MEIQIVNQDRKRETTYTPTMLRLDAAWAVRGLGRLTGYRVVFHEGVGNVALVSSYVTKTGETGEIRTSI